MAVPEITLESVTKKFGSVTALENVDLSIERGEFVCVIGPSGCGKTTTLKMVNRLIEPTGGRILIDGQDIAGVTQDSLRSQIGMVMQETTLFTGTIRENIAFGRFADELPSCGLTTSDMSVETALTEKFHSMTLVSWNLEGRQDVPAARRGRGEQ